MRWDEVSRAINASLSTFRIEFLEAATDRHVRANNQNNIRKSPIAPIIDLVQHAPRRSHTHDRGLARTCRHLAGVTLKPRIAFCLAIVARFLARNGNALQKICSSLSEKDNG